MSLSSGKCNETKFYSIPKVLRDAGEKYKFVLEKNTKTHKTKAISQKNNARQLEKVAFLELLSKRVIQWIHFQTVAVIQYHSV